MIHALKNSERKKRQVVATHLDISRVVQTVTLLFVCLFFLFLSQISAESIPQIIPNKLWWLVDLDRAWKYRVFKFSVKFDLRFKITISQI